MNRATPILCIASLVAACSSSGGPTRDSRELSLWSWNVLHGANAAGELNLAAKGEYLASTDADIVFLQEIDHTCERSGKVDQMAALARATSMDAAFGAFMPFQGGEYGLGTLSAVPVRSSHALRLPDGDEPRVALFRELEVLGHPLLAVNVHFNWTRDDRARFAQARALLDELASRGAATIVAGDFNDVPASRTMQAFYEAGFTHVEAPGPSWNAEAPSVDIDHILIRDGGRLRIESLGGEVVVESSLSDHRPVRGRVRVRVNP